MLDLKDFGITFVSSDEKEGQTVEDIRCLMHEEIVDPEENKDFAKWLDEAGLNNK